MIQKEVVRRLRVLRQNITQVLRRLEENPKDAAGLLQDLDAMSDTYQLALRGGMGLAYEWAAAEKSVEEGVTTETIPITEALAAMRQIAEKSPTWETTT